jgi:hypothetical protein
MENAGAFCPTGSPTAETLLADKSSCAFNQGKKLIKNKNAAENFMNHLKIPNLRPLDSIIGILTAEQSYKRLIQVQKS